MSNLTAAERDRIPRAEFALPEKEMFPLIDMQHARAAEGLAGRALKAGTIDQAEYNEVEAKAKAYLAKHPLHP